MEEHVSESYIRRCHKALRAMDAPLEGWFCTDVDDYEDDSFTCELCGCKKVRFVHRMEHRNYPVPILVGCICAGIMEGDIIAAQERERLVRNRAHRRDHFVHDGWHIKPNGIYARRYHRRGYRIMKSFYNDNQYGVWYKEKWCWRCCGKPMTSFEQAARALFHIIDPPIEVRHVRA